MAAQVGVSAREVDQSEDPQAPPTASSLEPQKPAIGPKPHLTPKPFSLHKNSIRPIAAPKLLLNKVHNAVRSPQATASGPPGSPVNTDPVISLHAEVATSTQSVPTATAKPSSVEPPKPDSAALDRLVTQSVQNDTSQNDQNSTPKLMVAPKLSLDKTSSPDQTKTENQEGTTIPKQDYSDSSCDKPPTQQDSIQTLQTHTEDKVALRTRTKSMSALYLRKNKENLQEPDQSTIPASETSGTRTAPRWPRQRLSVELTSMFEPADPAPLRTSKPWKAQTGISQSGDDEKEPVTDHPAEPEQKPKPSLLTKKDKEGKESDVDESSGGSIKRRITMLLDSSSANQQREAIIRRDESQAQATPETSVDVKQRIKDLTSGAGGPQNSTRCLPSQRSSAKSSEAPLMDTQSEGPAESEDAAETAFEPAADCVRASEELCLESESAELVPPGDEAHRRSGNSLTLVGKEMEVAVEDEETTSAPVYRRVGLMQQEETRRQKEAEKEREQMRLRMERQKQQEEERRRKREEDERFSAEKEKEMKEEMEKQRQIEEKERKQREAAERLKLEKEVQQAMEVERERQKEEERKRQEETKMRLEKELERQREEEIIRQKEEEERQKQKEEEERKRHKAEEERLRLEKEMEHKREEEQKRQREEEERLKLEGELESQREEERKRQKEEEEKLRLQMERKRDEDRKRQKEDEEKLRLLMEIKREEETKRQREEEERLKLEREMERQKEEERKRQKEEEERLRLELERKREEERKRQREQEEMLKLERETERQKEEERKRKKEEEERLRLELERKKEEERKRQREEEERLKLESEIKRQKEEERRQQKEEEERLKLEMERKREEKRKQQKEEQERFKLEREKEIQREEERKRQREEEEKLRLEREMERQKEEKRKQQKEEEERLRLDRKRQIEEEERIRLEMDRKREEERKRQKEEERQRLDRQMEKQREEERKQQKEEEERLRLERENDRQREAERERQREEEERIRIEEEQKRQTEEQKKQQEKLMELKQHVKEEASDVIVCNDLISFDSYESTQNETPAPSATDTPKSPEVVYDDFSVKPRRWGTRTRAPIGTTEDNQPSSWSEQLSLFDPLNLSSECLGPETKVLVDSPIEVRNQRRPPSPVTPSPDLHQSFQSEKQTEMPHQEEEDCEIPPAPAEELVKSCLGLEDGTEEGDKDALIKDSGNQYGTLDTDERFSRDSPHDQILADTPSECDIPDSNIPSEPEPLPLPESIVPLLDSSVHRSKAELLKRRSQRARPPRQNRLNATRSLVQDDSTPDWRFCDSTAKVKSDSDTDEEQAKEKEASPAPSQPHRIALPVMDPSALKAHLKKRGGGGEADSQPEGFSPTSVTATRSPSMSLGPRVLPPIGEANNGTNTSPSWLKELKSKKRLSQYDSEA
ncbi:182 kDa tankyrase-1-binding protein isoform X2 [Denticeps clupeoides]|uniref:182 kDa tankyrase-1-binding protein isoform X2 n=1 Tax=Denticeps clupeoides TaxID=299321 RepID=UPI0010A43398|nr:trichohyalin-like isoform X2 [Denticeps clupeoides]